MVAHLLGAMLLILYVTTFPIFPKCLLNKYHTVNRAEISFKKLKNSVIWSMAKQSAHKKMQLLEQILHSNLQ